MLLSFFSLSFLNFNFSLVLFVFFFILTYFFCCFRRSSFSLFCSFLFRFSIDFHPSLFHFVSFPFTLLARFCPAFLFLIFLLLPHRVFLPLVPFSFSFSLLLLQLENRSCDVFQKITSKHMIEFCPLNTVYNYFIHSFGNSGDDEILCTLSLKCLLVVIRSCDSEDNLMLIARVIKGQKTLL